MENNTGNEGLPSRLSAAEKLQQLKTQQAKLEKRAMPAHSKLKMSDVKKKIHVNKIPHYESRKFEALKSDTSFSHVIESSSSSKKSSVRTGQANDPSRHTRVEKKAEENENAKWKRRTQIIYEVERIGIQLKEIIGDCEEREGDLDTAKQDLTAAIESLKKSLDEYSEFARSQRETFQKRIKQIDCASNMHVEKLMEKVTLLNESLVSLNEKMDLIEERINKVKEKQSGRTPTERFIEYGGILLRRHW